MESKKQDESNKKSLQIAMPVLKLHFHISNEIEQDAPKSAPRCPVPDLTGEFLPVKVNTSQSATCLRTHGKEKTTLCKQTSSSSYLSYDKKTVWS